MNTDNNKMTVILEQLERSYKFGYENEQDDVTRKILGSIKDLLQSALKSSSEMTIHLFLVSDLHGPFLHRIQDITSRDLRDRIEKQILTDYLIYLPTQFLYKSRIDNKYLELIVPKTIFDLVKIIIENDDFVSFERLVERSTMIHLRDEPGKLASEIKYNVMFDKIYNKEIEKLVYDIEFAIEIEGVRSQENLMKFYKLLDEYEMASSKLSPIKDELGVTRDFQKLKTDAWHVYVNSLIYQAFFWVGAYIIFKGKSYSKYLEKLWKITKPKEGHVTFVNRPPVPEDLTWTMLLLLEQDEISWTSGPSFGSYQSPLPYMYKYFGLILLNSKEGFHFPSESELKPFFDGQHNDILAKWSGVCSRLQSKSFIEYTQNIEEFIDLDKFFEKENMRSMLRERLEKLQNSAKACEEMIVRNAPLVETKVDEAITNTVDAYQKQSRIEVWAKIKTSTTKIPGSSIFSQKYAIGKDFFQENVAVAHFLQFDDIGHILASFEEDVLLKEIREKITEVHTIKFEDLVPGLEKIFEAMQKNEHEPNLILIHHNMLREYYKQKRTYDIDITIKNKVIKTMFSNQLKNNEIYLIDNTCLEMSYLKLKNGRIEMRIDTNPDNPKEALIQTFMEVKPLVTEPLGIAKILVSGIKEKP